MPDERDWTRREILRTAAAGSLASSVYSRRSSCDKTRTLPIRTGFVAKMNCPARATG